MKFKIDNSDFKLINKKIMINNKLFNNKEGFILFYSNYCNKCNIVKEFWEDFNKRFENIFVFLLLNCDDILLENDLCCMNNNIKNYPTIKYFNKNGKLYNYDGLINKDDISRFIYSKMY